MWSDATCVFMLLFSAKLAAYYFIQKGLILLSTDAMCFYVVLFWGLLYVKVLVNNDGEMTIFYQIEENILLEIGYSKWDVQLGT